MEDFVTVNISSDLIQADYTYYSLLLALYQSQMKQDSQPDSEGDDDGGGGGSALWVVAWMYGSMDHVCPF